MRSLDWRARNAIPLIPPQAAEVVVPRQPTLMRSVVLPRSKCADLRHIIRHRQHQPARDPELDRL